MLTLLLAGPTLQRAELCNTMLAGNIAGKPFSMCVCVMTDSRYSLCWEPLVLGQEELAVHHT